MDGYSYVEKRDVPLCDFCCANDAVFAYLATDKLPAITVPHKDGIAVIQEGDLGWGACAGCSPLVDKKNPHDLAVFVAERMPTKTEVPRHLLVMSLEAIYLNVLPMLRDKQPAHKMKGGAVIAHGDEEFIKDVKEWRDELNAARGEL